MYRINIRKIRSFTRLAICKARFYGIMRAVNIGML
jgi:hypothetical protein